MYNLNINKSSVVPTNLIVGRVIDKPFDSIYFKIFDGQNPLNLTGCTVEFRGTTPDGKKVVSDNVPITNSIGGEIRFTFPPNFYSAKGHFQNAYFVIKKGGYIESTNDLLINVLNAVDFNVDDAPIIIDQLDDLIQAVIDDINKQLSTVKLDIKQTQNNIDTLKKDVDAYKKEFGVEIGKMQKQLDDLAKAINQTDIQRPQITLPTGGQFDINDKNKTILDFAKQLGAGTKKVYIHNAVGIPEQYLHGLMNIARDFSIITFEGSAVISGNAYSFAHLSGVDKGWKRLDGQVQKITNDNGSYKTVSGNGKSTYDSLVALGVGIHFVYLTDGFTDLPVNYIAGVARVLTLTSGELSFVGCGMAMGLGTGTYSYNGKSKIWSRLDGQVQKITNDDGKVKHITISDTLNAYEILKDYGEGMFTVYLHTSVGQPENYIMGTVIQSKASGGAMEGFFEGVGLTSGESYTYSYATSGVKGWRKVTTTKV